MAYLTFTSVTNVTSVKKCNKYQECQILTLSVSKSVSFVNEEPKVKAMKHPFLSVMIQCIQPSLLPLRVYSFSEATIYSGGII